MKSISALTYIFIVSFFVFSGCGDENNTDISGRIDSSFIPDTTVIDSTARDSLEQSALNNIVSAFGGKYSIYSGWSKITEKDLKKLIRESVKSSRYFLIPVFQSHIEQAKLQQVNDTTFSYLGKQDNSFVFIIKGGESTIEKLNRGENGLMVFKPSDIEGKYIILLTKGPKDFQHRSKRVFEFTIEGKIIDAVNIKNISEKNLRESFGLNE